MENQIVIFELGSEFFGADIAKFESIIQVQPITQLPHAPAFVEGVTNLRGKVLLVIDLRKRFALPAQETEVGMIVDEVSEVLTVPEGAVKAAPAIATTVDSSFIKGIAKIEERLVILLDLTQLLSTKEQAEIPIH